MKNDKSKKLRVLAAIIAASLTAIGCFFFAACAESGGADASVTPGASVAISASSTPSVSATPSGASVRPSASTTPSVSASVRTSASATSDSASATASTSSGGGNIQPAQSLPDDHQGTAAEDASWQRYDLYAASAPLTMEAASYVTIVDGVGANRNWANSRANSENYYPVGNLNNNTDCAITFTITLSAAAKVGIYGQFSNRATTDPLIKFSDIFSLSVNGAKKTVSGVNLPQGGSNYAPTNRYVFLGFADLNAGSNTVTIKVVMPSDGNNGYNFYGFRFSASSATIQGA